MGYVIGPVRLALPAVCTDIANIRRRLKLLAGAVLKSTTYGLAIHLSASATPSGTAFLPAYAGAFAARSIVTALPQWVLSGNPRRVLPQLLRHMTPALVDPFRDFG